MNIKQIIRKLRNLPAGIEIIRNLNFAGSVMKMNIIARGRNLTEVRGLTVHKVKRYFWGEVQDHEALKPFRRDVEITVDKHENF